MQKNAIETITGAVVLIIAGVFLFHASKHSDLTIDSEGDQLQAKFSDATGISAGSDVRIGGVKIGVVSNMGLDETTYEATTTLQLKKGVQVPADSSAAIVSSGLLGDKFIAITPGGDDTMLKSGEKIEFTQSSVSLEELIGKFMFSGGGVDKEEKPAPGPSL